MAVETSWGEKVTPIFPTSALPPPVLTWLLPTQLCCPRLLRFPTWPGGIFDHTPLQVVLNLTSSRRSGAWRLHPGWVAESSVEALVSTHLKEYWDHNEGTADRPVV